MNILTVRLARRVLLGFALLLTAVLGVKAHASEPQPYTIYQHYTINGPHGINVVDQRIIAHRSDGSRVEQIATPRNAWNQRTINYSNGLEVKLYDEVKVVSSAQHTPEGLARRKNADLDPASDCAWTLDKRIIGKPNVIVGRDVVQIEGVGTLPVVKLAMEPDPSFVITKAPSLGCAEISHVKTFSDSTSALILDKIVFGEPDPALFRVPTDYQEMTFSAANEAHLRFAHVPEANITSIKNGLKRMDDIYAAHRPTAEELAVTR